MAETELMARMRLTLELNELGIQMYAQRLRREQPEADEADIIRQVNEWLGSRPPDAPAGIRSRDR